MDELIKRLEAASGPDRELDADIATSLGKPVCKDDPCNWVIKYPGAYDYRKLPRYTASIDAALTLVPEGLDWFVKHYASAGGKYGAVVTSPEIAARSWGDYSHDDAATPAIALCIAALRARSAAPPPTARGSDK